jgi:rod shape-determining protein MreD
MILASMLFMVLAAGLLQDLVPTTALLGEVKVPLLLGVTLYYAITERGTAIVMTTAVLAGILQDSLSLVPLGFSSFLFGCLGLGVQRLPSHIVNRRWQSALVLGGLGYALYIILMQNMLVAGTDFVPGPAWWFWVRVVVAAIMGGAITPLVWRLAGHLEELLGIEPAWGH